MFDDAKVQIWVDMGEDAARDLTFFILWGGG
jgi:hypothetical protein